MQLHLALFVLWIAAVLAKDCDKGSRRHRNHLTEGGKRRGRNRDKTDKTDFYSQFGGKRHKKDRKGKKSFRERCAKGEKTKATKKPENICGSDDNLRYRDGGCYCKAGYEDIVDTDEYDAKKYKRGEKCVKEKEQPKKKCESDKAVWSDGVCYCIEGYVDIVDSDDSNAKYYKRGERCIKKDNEKPKPKCKSDKAVWSDGVCYCIEGYVDIVDTDDYDAKNYKRGEKCVKKEEKPKPPKDSTSVIFAIDSSTSITAEQWPCLVDFVKVGAEMLSNKFRVGFIKFGDNITANSWLEPGWSERDYKNAVPTKYDDAETNTPLALEEARRMFQRDYNKNKIVVLITDGLPVVPDTYREEESLAATQYAADQLSRSDIRLTVMGVGPELEQGVGHVKKWLKNPNKDYSSFTDPIKCLKKKDFEKLLALF